MTETQMYPTRIVTLLAWLIIGSYCIFSLDTFYCCGWVSMINLLCVKKSRYISLYLCSIVKNVLI